MIGTQPHRGIDGVHVSDAFIQRIDRLVDHRQQDTVDDEGGEILGIGSRLADALDDFEELVLRDRDRVLDALGTQRSEVGELPLNAADAEPEPIDTERHKALTDCHAEWARRGAREPHDFFHRLNGDDCLERLGWSFGERCFCNSQAIRIGSRHD